MLWLFYFRIVDGIHVSEKGFVYTHGQSGGVGRNHSGQLVRLL